MKMPPVKYDVKKQFPDFYKASANNVEIVDVPEMQFFMIDGHGDPNSAQSFQDAIATLYACSYTLKMSFKKMPKGKDYVVPPLEGLWYLENMAEWSMDAKDKWNWTIMIRIPDFVPKSEITKSIETVKQKKREKAPAIDKLRVEEYHEKFSVQLLHIGPYNAEPPNIQKMHSFAKSKNYILNGKHHEIYLSDFRKIAPEKLKTILRQPISKK